jgi:hypothetical protein
MHSFHVAVLVPYFGRCAIAASRIAAWAIAGAARGRRFALPLDGTRLAIPRSRETEFESAPGVPACEAGAKVSAHAFAIARD